MAYKDWSDYFAASYGTGGFSEGMKMGMEKSEKEKALAQQDFTNRLALEKFIQDAKQNKATEQMGMLKQGYTPSPNLMAMPLDKQAKYLARAGGRVVRSPIDDTLYGQRPNLGVGGMIDTGMMDESGNPIYKNKSQANFDRLMQNQQDTRWQQFLNKNDPKLASSRSTLGQVSVANLRANRALELLDNPTVTYQDMQAAVADFAGIMQAGSPTDQAMKHADYTTMYGTMNNILQYLDGNPRAAIPPKIKQHLKENFLSLREIDNKYLKDHLESARKTYGHLRKRMPENWQGFEDNMNNLIQGYKPSKNKSGSIPKGASHYSPSTGKYYDAKGNVVQ